MRPFCFVLHARTIRTMLISHPYRFVFIKTVETAGTSVEAFLSLSLPSWACRGALDAHADQRHGVVGQRWPRMIATTLVTNHMPAVEIRQRCPQFDDYTGSPLRDPYDRAISISTAPIPPSRIGGSLDEAIALLGQGQRSALQERYFLRHGLPDEKALLCIEGKLAVQRWVALRPCIRIWNVWLDLGLPRRPVAEACSVSSATVKGVKTAHADDYLSAEALELIHQQCSWSFDTFHYQRRSVSSLF